MSTTASASTTNINECVCKPGYVWSTDVSLPDQCILDCSGLANSPHTNPTALSCACDSGFTFQDSTATPPNVCARDCSSLPFATGTDPAAPAQCLCQTGYGWSLTGYTDQCSIDCSADTHSTGANSVSTCAC